MTLDKLRSSGEQYRSLREQTEQARDTLQNEIRYAVAFTSASEAEIARAAGVTRMTVRKALGK